MNKEISSTRLSIICIIIFIISVVVTAYVEYHSNKNLTTVNSTLGD